MPVTIVKKEERVLPSVSASEFFQYAAGGAAGLFTIFPLENLAEGQLPEPNAFVVTSGGKKFLCRAQNGHAAPLENARPRRVPPAAAQVSASHPDHGVVQAPSEERR